LTRDRGDRVAAKVSLARRRFGRLVAVLVSGVALGLVVGSVALGDAPGPTLTVDQSFNSGQPVAPQFAPDGSGASPGGTVFASAIQPDGKVIVAGQNGNGSAADFDVARYNSNGTLDTSFGSGGYMQVAPTANNLNFADAVALDPNNGDIVIAGGDISGTDVPELVRLTPGGALDTGFGSNGSVVDSANTGSYLVAVVVDSSDRVVTIGSDGVVRRYTANGSVDSMFGSGGHTGVLVSGPAVGSDVLALQPADGKIVAAGTSSGAGTVVRLNTDGSLDPTFGGGGTATLASGTAIRQMTLEGTSIVVGGNDSANNGMLARLTSTGGLDTTFGRSSGYDTFAAPSGYSEHVDALFYDPGSPPGLIFCLYQSKMGSQTGGCSTLGVDGQTAGTPIPIQGTPKDGGYSFIPNSWAVWLSYFGIGRDTTKPGTGGGGSNGGAGGTPPTACTPVKLEIGKFIEPTRLYYYNPIPTAVVEVPPQSHHYRVGYDPNGKYPPEVQFLIIVINDGSCPATNLQLTDQLSSNVAFQRFHQVAGPPTRQVVLPRTPGSGGTFTANIPSLLPGEEVQLEIEVKLGTSGTNTACVSGAFGQICSNPVDWKTVPAPLAKISTLDATSVQGDAGPWGAPAKDATDTSTRSRGGQVEVTAVKVAIERLTSGHSSHQSARCSWLANSKAKFKKRACDQPIWLEASGRTHWRLSYRRLSPGRYEAFAMALGKQGLSGDTFRRGAGDIRIFIVR
jgi:uncharacterized delta-60 repeat protein/uncharacterized repeat protein (TIGR01451 family)